MSKIMEVFFTEEVEEKVSYTGQHIRRLIKENKVDLIEKLMAYKGNTTRGKKKEE